MTSSCNKDIIIFGGGIAGLWLLNRLHDLGYDVLLLEAGQLGQGQTLASQGMIHGGVKYTLEGSVTGASQSIAEMPDHWKACMAGRGDVDLRGTSLLSSRYFMWPRQSIRSRLTAFLGSKALQGKVLSLKEKDYPDFFRGHIPGPLYQLTDIVLDVPSLLQTLSQRHRERICQAATRQLTTETDTTGSLAALHVQTDGSEPVRLTASRYIFTSGEGTETLLSHLDLPAVAMQRRPLHMVMVRHRNPHPIYVHCVSDQLTATPALTVTTHPADDGGSVWYLGGELAESGVDFDTQAQISRAGKLLGDYFPWCDFSSTSWDTLRINRAEPRQPSGKRPDSFFMHEQGNTMVCWPTKLTLAPALANRLVQRLGELGLAPAGVRSANPDLPFPGIAATPWSHL